MERNEAIKQDYRVLVPEDDEDAMHKTCSICKERLDTIWNEDDEQWEYVGVVKNNLSQICHFKCVK